MQLSKFNSSNSLSKLDISQPGSKTAKNAWLWGMEELSDVRNCLHL